MHSALAGAATTLVAQNPRPAYQVFAPTLFDTTCAACQDFYQFATGGWSRHAAPTDSSEPRSASSEVEERTLQQLQRLLDSLEARRTTLTDPVARKLGIFYASCKGATRLSKQELQELDWLAGGVLALDSLSSRDIKCVRITDQVMTDFLGQVYVKRYFSPKSQARVAAIAANVKAAFHERLLHTPWLDDSSRTGALAKLAAITVKVGYPSTSLDQASVKITSDTAYRSNVMAAAAFQDQLRLARIGSAYDPTRWQMAVPRPDAMILSSRSEIVFPAAFLQPPIFDSQADDAVNYGAIGAIIGHEIAHEFVGAGLDSNVKGGKERWLTDSSQARYQRRAQVVVQQFDGYTVNGERVSGWGARDENLADLVGLQVAYAAFQKSLVGKPRPQPIDGFTPPQRFFLAWAQVLRENNAQQRLSLRAPHTPGHFRTNGPLSNLPEFAEAWGCNAGTPMTRLENARAVIW